MRWLTFIKHIWKWKGRLTCLLHDGTPAVLEGLGLMNIAYLAPFFYKSVVDAAVYFSLFSTHFLISTLKLRMPWLFLMSVRSSCEDVHELLPPAITLTSGAFKFREDKRKFYFPIPSASISSSVTSISLFRVSFQPVSVLRQTLCASVRVCL
jgi:hypothetical protein